MLHNTRVSQRTRRQPVASASDLDATIRMARGKAAWRCCFSGRLAA